MTKNNADSSTKNLLLRGLSFVFLIMAMVSGVMFYREYQLYQEGKNAYAAIAQTVRLDSGNSDIDALTTKAVGENQTAIPAGEASETGSRLVPMPSAEQLDYQRIRKILNINFDRLIGINPDAIGWIFSENTIINYPMVQGRDNSYYMNHLVSNEVNKLGSIFVDYRNKPDFSDEHTLIFGHNMNDGSMFNELERYKDPEYYQDHKSIYLLTEDQYFRVDIFAGYVTTPQKIGQIYFTFDTQDARVRYISDAKRLSNFTSELELSEEDRIVSFFTCDYATEDARFVVIGKLVPLNP